MSLTSTLAYVSGASGVGGAALPNQDSRTHKLAESSGAIENFDVRVDRTNGRYRTLVSSLAGEATCEFDLAPNAMDSRGQFSSSSGAAMAPRDLQPVQAGPAASPDEDAMSVGGWLFETIFKDAVLRCLDSAMAMTRPGRLRIRLRLDDTLANLPWETLYDAQRARFLALGPDTLLVRYMEIGSPPLPLSVSGPLTILVMIASPAGLPPLDGEREWARLKEDLRDRENEGEVLLERLAPATLESLGRRLRDGDCHVLHFVGHGDFDAQKMAGLLLLEDESGAARAVSAEQFAGAVGADGAPRLIVLNACKGATADSSKAFAGTAQQLVQQGIPAVLAMRTSIADQAAVHFADEFYGAVADSRPVDAAMVPARRVLQDSTGGVEWAIPILFMRSPSGNLFDVHLNDDERRQRRRRRLEQQALAAETAEDWATAAESWALLSQLEPADPAISRSFSRAQRMSAAIPLFHEGNEHFAAGRWAKAIECFTGVLDRAGNYGGTTLSLLFSAQLKLQHMLNGDSPTPGEVDGSVPEAAEVADALARRRVVIFLGSDANLCGRPRGAEWLPGQTLPCGRELASALAREFRYPWPDHDDLVRVAQYVEVTRDAASLYEAVREQLGNTFAPTPLHLLLATVRRSLDAKGHAPEDPLVIISANYDDALESTFVRAGEPFELLSYSVELDEREDPVRGAFRHRFGPDLRDEVIIDDPTAYVDIPRHAADVRTVIVKIHGSPDLRHATPDRYLITEDQYVNYSALLPRLVPRGLNNLLSDAYFLFLGYSLCDWNLRVFVNTVWPPYKRRSRAAWVVPWRGPGGTAAIDPKFWAGRKVDLPEVDLDRFVEDLGAAVEGFPPAARRV
jgi:hypothetical protein